MSMIETATGTLARADSTSTRSAIVFAMASRSISAVLSCRCRQTKIPDGEALTEAAPPAVDRDDIHRRALDSSRL
jgi:hypothetical protein